MTTSIFGSVVYRVEDPRFLTGRARYVDALRPEGALWASFVRSIIAHGRLSGVEVSEASGMPGVVAVFTASDLGLKPRPPAGNVEGPFERPIPASGVVRYFGEPVAIVIAGSSAQAADAAEVVVVDVDPLEPVLGVDAALADGAPLLFPEAGTNARTRLARHPRCELGVSPHFLTGRSSTSTYHRIVPRRLLLGVLALAVLAAACGGVEDVEDVLDPSGTPTTSASPTAEPSEEPSPEPTGDGEPAIVVRIPVAGDEVVSPVTVAGTADVFEATVSIRILDANGQELAATFATATCGSGCRGRYSEEVFFFTQERQDGTIEVFESSAADGSPLNLVRIPVVLVPGI